MTSTHAWFVKTKTGIAGPFTPGQLKGFADSEKLPKSALVSKQADGPWLQAGADKTVTHQVISANPECSKQSDDEDIVARMAKLKSLFDNGLISQEEYQAKRSHLLDSI